MTSSGMGEGNQLSRVMDFWTGHWNWENVFQHSISNHTIIWFLLYPYFHKAFLISYQFLRILLTLNQYLHINLQDSKKSISELFLHSNCVNWFLHVIGCCLFFKSALFFTVRSVKILEIIYIGIEKRSPLGALYGGKTMYWQ